MAAELTNVELALHEIIQERGETTGYEIGRIIRERGYSEWANIGKTSIYAGIRSLEKERYIVLKQSTKEGGKGPIPNGIRITESGETVLLEEVRKALLSQRNPPRYYLGIAGISLIDKGAALDLLRQREAMDRESIKGMSRLFKERGGTRLPLEARALFEHPIMLIKSDVLFLRKFIRDFAGENHG